VGAKGQVGGFTVAKCSAAALETAWRIARRAEEPPITRFAVAICGQHYQIDCARASSDLGWRSRDDYARAIRDSIPYDRARA
jgi:nucleoside-diphosphate-sugar epimerase